MGDFNAGSGSTEMRPLRTRFLDAWVEAGVGGGNTSPARLSGNPTSRIDYIFVSTDVEVATTFVPVNASTRLASDHYPVVSDIAVPGSEVGIHRKEPTPPAHDEPAEEIVEEEETEPPPV
jgi:endonuclease/exonuclease/phosphatase family metal-dependent hydrolase